MDRSESARDRDRADGTRGPTSGRSWGDCIDRLYESVAQEDAFADAVGAFRPFFHARWSTFLTAPSHSDHQSVHVAACGVPVASLLEYHSHYHLHDEWAKAGWAANAMIRDAAYSGSELVPPERLKETYFYKDFLQRYGISDILCAILEPPSERGPVAFVTFHRLHGQPLYERHDVDALRELAPHLRRALRLHQRLGPQIAFGSTLRDLFLAMDAPMLFLGTDGAVVEQNPAARRLIAGSSLLRASAQGLLYRSGDAWHRVADRLPSIAAGATGALQAAGSAPGEGKVTLDFRVVHGAFTDRLMRHPSALVCTLREHVDPAEAARRRYQLTAAETRVARLLIAGTSPAAIATTLGIGMATVRTHISHLFEKTGTGRQAELATRLRAEGDEARE